MSTEAKKSSNSIFSNPLKLVKPFVPILPQVKGCSRAPSLREKFIWTVLAVLIYLIASQIPLYGILTTNVQDHAEWLRILIASSRGTLMDLGTGPVVTASIIMQLLSSAKLIEPDFSIKEDKVLYDSMQKLIAILLTVGQALVQIITGFYGPYESLTTSSCLLVVIQLVISGLLVILLDELLQKGYGIGNGVNLFIVTNICERIVWNALSPKVFYTGRGLEFEGCLVATVHLLFSRRNKLFALQEIMFREHLPNLSSLFFTILIFLFVVYIQSIRVELPIISRKHKGISSLYPINLMYSSTNPIIFQNTIVSQFFNVSKLIYKFAPKNIFVKLFGVWELQPRLGYVPISGLCYYIYPPGSYTDLFKRPVFFVLYCVIMLGTSAFLSVSLLESQQEDAAVVFKKIKDQDMQLKGIRDNNAVEKLNEYIPVAAFLSGVLTSFVILFCDLFSVVGSGSNIFLVVGIISQYIKLVATENAKRSGKAVIE